MVNPASLYQIRMKKGRNYDKGRCSLDYLIKLENYLIRKVLHAPLGGKKASMSRREE